MKPLMFSVFCPNDCDRPKVVEPVVTIDESYLDWCTEAEADGFMTLAPESIVAGPDWDSLLDNLSLPSPTD